MQHRQDVPPIPGGKWPEADAGPTPVASIVPDSGVGAGKTSLPADHLERIIRRAAQLQNRGDDHAEGRLTADEVIRIAEEVGLEAQYVRRAIAELHAESLIPDDLPENRLIDAVFGAGWVQVRRVMSGEALAIQQRIETQLADQEGLIALRRGPLRSVWERARGVSKRMKRKLSDRDFTLAKSRTVDLRVGQLEPGWSLVTISADIANRRKSILEGPMVWVLIGTFFGTRLISRWLGMSAAGIGGLLIGALILAVSAGIAIWYIRYKLAEKRQRVALVLDGVLDRAA